MRSQSLEWAAITESICQLIRSLVMKSEAQNWSAPLVPDPQISYVNIQRAY